MEGNLCLGTQHFPAMRHHKNVVVHSSVRLPALQVKAGPPPGSARVAVVGAGVVLACALGAMYWKRARALQLPMHRSSQTSRAGGIGDDHQASGNVSIGELHTLLYKICIRTSDPMLARLPELPDQGLMIKLQKRLPETELGEHEYIKALAAILALISEQKYTEAREIVIWLQSREIVIPSDARPDLLLAIINMMMAMESMLQFPNTTSPDDLKEKLELVENPWEDYKRKSDIQGAPPKI